MTPAQAASSPAGARPVLAVADFAGGDGETSRFLAETLMTALAESDKVRLLGCTEVRRALADAKLDGAGLVETAQIQRVGQAVGADYLVVGSYLERGDQLLINAHLLDTASGRPAPGCAGSAAGASKELLTLAQGLARQLRDHVIEYAAARKPEAPKADAPKLEAPKPAPPDTSGDPIPPGARMDDVLSESDLAGLVTRVAQILPGATAAPVTVQNPAAPVTRFRVLAALIKLVVPPDALTSQPTAADSLPPDAAQAPAWGKPYLAAAVEQGWCTAEEPIGAKEKATWGFVKVLLARMPAAGAEAPAGPYTGLIVDAHEFGIQRAMGPRILDEEGGVLYPDPKHVPSADALQNEGMVSYTTDPKDTRRSGARPLIVTAVQVTGPAREDVVVSKETADQIREANRRWRFLSRRAVSIVIPAR